MQKLVIVRDWIILADDDSTALDFRTPSSIFYVMFTWAVHVPFQSDATLFTTLSLMPCVFGWFKRYFVFIDRTYQVYRLILK